VVLLDSDLELLKSYRYWGVVIVRISFFTSSPLSATSVSRLELSNYSNISVLLRIHQVGQRTLSMEEVEVPS